MVNPSAVDPRYKTSIRKQFAKRETIDMFVTFQFLKKLTTPFKNWDAYKLGIIDDKGNVLRKTKTLTEPEELAAWGYFERLVCNLKKLLTKVPNAQTKFATYNTALFLVKECADPREIDDDELAVMVESYFDDVIMPLCEDGEGVAAAPVNNVGDGKVAGLGIGPQGEPPKKAKLNAMFKRKMIDVGPKVRT